MKDSKIEWTHHTFNPWWGCQRVSPGCENCYAETFSARLGRKLWGPGAMRKPASDSYWAQPLKWNSAALAASERHRVFCASMADVFEDRRELDAHRDRLWALIEATPALDWLLLTKRPENMPALAPARWSKAWPSNVWAGTTVEDQRRAEDRIPILLAVPATVRFLSCEPLIGKVDLTKVEDDELGAKWNALEMGIHWVIVGGESGHGARVFDLGWARSIVHQCKDAGVAVHVKQLGAAASDPENGIAGAALKISSEAAQLVSLRLRDRKGGDWSEWPEELRVRQYPVRK